MAAALLRQPFSQDFFGPAGCFQARRHGVDIRGVQKIHAVTGSLVQDSERNLLVALVAEGHGAQADLADLEAGAAQGAMLHRAPPVDSSAGGLLH